MFRKILKRDLKRKKSMNTILLLFMILIGMLVAGSTNMLYTVTTALDTFMEKSSLADFMIFSYSNEDSDKQIQEWADNCEYVDSISYDNLIDIKSENIKLPEHCEEYSDTTTLAIGTQSKISNMVFNNNDDLLKTNDGEMAIPIFFSDSIGLKIGDKVTITIGQYSKEFVVKNYTKDVVLGSAMMGFKRLLISDC